MTKSGITRSKKRLLVAFSVRNTIKGSKLWKNGRNIKGDFHLTPNGHQMDIKWDTKMKMEVSFNVAPIFSQFTALDCIPDTKSYQN